MHFLFLLTFGNFKFDISSFNNDCFVIFASLQWVYVFIISCSRLAQFCKSFVWLSDYFSFWSYKLLFSTFVSYLVLSTNFWYFLLLTFELLCVDLKLISHLFLSIFLRLLFMKTLYGFCRPQYCNSDIILSMMLTYTLIVWF